MGLGSMKETLILLHGAVGSKSQFDELRAILSSQFDVHAFNFSGHGGDSAIETYSIDLFVQNTLNFMQVHQLESAHFFGYSMGGYVALKLAKDYPGRAQKIITLGTKFKWDPESAAKDVRMMNPDIIEQKIPGYAAMLAVRHHPGDWKSIMSRTAEMMTALGAGLAMTSSDFESIPHQVLISIGAEDHMVSVEESTVVANLLPHGSLRVIEGVKHPLDGIDKSMLSSLIKDYVVC
jgi:pimeloyl-ACP methyl ester carboxylesterase